MTDQSAIVIPQPRHAGGRPSSYDPAYCGRVIAFGQLGKSRAWIAAELGVSRQTLANWEAAHPEFLDAMAISLLESQRWWEDKGQESMDKPGFNSSIWNKNMACRFGDDWREKTDLAVTHDFSRAPTDKLEAFVNAGAALFGGTMAGGKERA